MTTIELLDKIKQGKSIRDDLVQNWKSKDKILLVGKYKVLQFINKGSFGEVYKVQHIVTGKEFALKIIDFKAIFQKNPGEKVKEKIETYLITEETLMRKCHSAYIIKIFDVIQNKRCKIFILQYCNSGSLDVYIKKRNAIQQNDAILILKQIIFGLAELHRNCIIHRDLKPANILMHKGIFKIADLGFSKELPTEETVAKGSLCGSKNTMAPEISKSQPYGLKADIWSLGMIFFLMTFCEETQDFFENRYRKALEIAYHNAPFVFNTINGQRISNQASDFLKKTLVVDHEKRMNWEQTLQHPLFKKESKKLPSIFVPEEKQQFHQLKERNSSDQLKTIVRFGAFNIQDLIKMREQNQQMVLNQDENYDKLNQQYLQCRKAEFIYSQILVPLQRKHLLEFKKRKHIEFFYLLSARCMTNISCALDAVKCLYNQQSNVFNYFRSNINGIHKKIRQKFQRYSQALTEIEGKVSEMLADRFSKIASFVSNKTEYKQKQKFLQGCQNIDFSREEQISYTYEKYIIDLINQVHGNSGDEKNMKKMFKAYRAINIVTAQQLGSRSFETFVEDVINQQYESYE